MRLSLDGLINKLHNSTKISKTNKTIGERDMNYETNNFDKVTLTSSSRDIEEKIFTETLTRKINNEMSDLKDRQNKIDDLKMSIQNKTYKVNSKKIAQAILFENGE